MREWFRRRERLVLVVGPFVVLLVLWEIAAAAGWISTLFFSSPSEVVQVGIESVQQSEFWQNVQLSTTEFLYGYLLGLVVGVAVGLVTGWYRRLGMLVEPLLTASNATPRIALVPLIVLWIGIGLWSKVAVVFLAVMVPVAVNAFHGVRTVERQHLQVARSFGASEPHLFRTVVVPATIPFVAAAARIGVGRGVGGVVVAEFYSSQEGLAHMIFDAGRQLQTGMVIWGTVVITAMALGAYRFVAFLEHRLTRNRNTVANVRSLA